MKKHKYIDPIEWAEKQNKASKGGQKNSPQPPAEPPQLVFEPQRDPHHTFAAVGVSIILIVIAVFAWVVTRPDTSYETRITNEVSLAGPLTSDSSESQQGSSLLEQTTYPASAQNPSYSMLFASERVAICEDATGSCGALIGNLGGNRDVQIFLQAQDQSPSAQSPQEDGQCEQITPAQTIESLIYICETGSPSAGILYYSFELELNGQSHYGFFSGINPRGQRFADMSAYQDEMYEILASISLQ